MRDKHLAKRCSGCFAADDRPLYTPTLLRGAWRLVPAADTTRHPVCEMCARVLIGGATEGMTADMPVTVQRDRQYSQEQAP